LLKTLFLISETNSMLKVYPSFFSPKLGLSFAPP